jgi:hypothetical protein
MFTVAYLKSLGERALVAFAASLAALLSAGGVGLLDAPWQQSLSVAGMAALLAVVGSVAGGGLTSSSAPALTSKSTERELAAEPVNSSGL